MTEVMWAGGNTTPSKLATAIWSKLSQGLDVELIGAGKAGDVMLKSVAMLSKINNDTGNLISFRSTPTMERKELKDGNVKCVIVYHIMIEEDRRVG